MAQQDKSYWFPAKRYGWGWGVPLCWQGWAVLAAYLAVIVAAGADLAAKGHMAAFNGAVVIATIALIAICWIKGEPPRWRWGND
jgi:hypothetical protein